MAYILSWKSNQIFTCLSVMSELCGTVPVQVIRNATDFQSPYLWKTNSETYYHCKKKIFSALKPPTHQKIKNWLSTLPRQILWLQFSFVSVVVCFLVFFSGEDEETLYCYSPCGLFPAPLPRNAKAAVINKVKAKFKFLGKFMAKALMDSRMVTTSFIIVHVFVLFIFISTWNRNPFHMICYIIVIYLYWVINMVFEKKISINMLQLTLFLFFMVIVDLIPLCFSWTSL